MIRRSLVLLAYVFCVPLPTFGDDAASLEKLHSQYEAAEASSLSTAKKIQETQAEKDREPLKDQLRDLVQSAFSLRIQIQEQQLNQSEANLIEAREQLQKRVELSDTIIRRRIDELISGEAIAWVPKESSSEKTRPLSPVDSQPSLEDTQETFENVTKQRIPAGVVLRALGITHLKSLSSDEIRVLNSRLGTHFRGGLIIGSVTENSIAHKQGVRQSDVLVGLSGFEVTSQDELVRTLESIRSEKKQRPRFYLVQNHKMFFGYFDFENFEKAERQAVDYS